MLGKQSREGSHTGGELLKDKPRVIFFYRAEQSFDDDNDDFMFPDTDVTKVSACIQIILQLLCFEQWQNREEADLEVTEEIMVSQAIRESTQSTSAPEVIDLSDADLLVYCFL